MFDGTFPGLLTAIFERYERGGRSIEVVSSDRYQPILLGHALTVVTDERKAKRVWEGLNKRLDRKWLMRWYAAFLAELPQGYQHLFDLSCYIFDQGAAVVNNYGNAHVLYITQLDRKVHREKHRMEAFVRFQQLADGTYYATVEPDFNVLPLIRTHFKKRYADQRWIIYDLKRNYGLYYDGISVVDITLAFDDDRSRGVPSTVQLASDEGLYQQLWKGYFQHTNIATRKNMKLHLRHIPTRYWKYLTEKGND